MKRVILAILPLALIAAAVTVSQANNRHAQTLATALVSYDLDGGAAAPAVARPEDIKAYVRAHMGTHTKFTLLGSYQRAVAAAQASATAQASNAQIYAAAQTACSGKTDSITQAKCNAQYLSTHLVALPTTPPVSAPQLASYQYDYRAPVWTPDLAGWLTLGALISLVATAIVLVRRRS